MRVALVSLNQRWLDKDANFFRCADFAYAASRRGCELIVFPEMTLTGYAPAIADIAEPDDAFEAGLFSTFPAAFSLSVNQLYRRIGLSRQVYESLAGQDTPINKLLHLAHACEHQNSGAMSKLSGKLGISMDSVAATHVEAVVTAEDIGSHLI